MPKRRSKGTGGLVQRHDHETCPPAVDGVRPAHKCQGRWQGTYDVELIDGGKKRRYVYGRTQKEARQKLARAIEDARGTPQAAHTITLGDWLEEWLEKRRRPPKPLKPNTWNGYRSKINQYIIPTLGKKPLPELRPQQVEAFYDWMRDQGLAEATVRQTHAILQRALKDAVRVGHLVRTPMDRVNPPGTETNDREQFTLDQAAIALKAAGDSARWWLALFYGMRQGEALGMDWRHVNWDAHTFAIEETRQNDYGYTGTVLGAPKSKASRRELPMLPQIEVRLRLLWEDQGRPTSGLVFPGANGKPQDPKRDWLAWRAFLTTAGLPLIALHAARNTAASLMEASGIPDRVVAQILGQSQVRTTHGYQRAELVRVRDYLAGVADVLELE